MPIASSARAMVPSEIQQLIGVDYRALKDSPTAQALKEQVLPENLKEFETALKGIGIDADRDLDQLNFASFRTEKKGIQTIGMAQGSFSAKAVLKKMKLKKITATKYGTAAIYPMDSGMVMTFLDDNTLAFGTKRRCTARSIPATASVRRSIPIRRWPIRCRRSTARPCGASSTSREPRP